MLESVFGFIEDNSSDPKVKQRMSDSKVSVNILKVLLTSVRNHDNAGPFCIWVIWRGLVKKVEKPKS